MKILFITNICPYYRVGLFALLSRMYDVRFLFFADEVENFDGDKFLGDFRGRYLPGYQVLPKVRLNPDLFRELLFGDYTHVIKCINGPIPLLASFVIAKLRRKKFILWTGVWQQPATFFHRLSFPFIKFIYRQSDSLVVYGTHVKKYLTDLGVPAEKVSVAWQVQNNEAFTKEVSAIEIDGVKEQIGIKTNRVLLFVGRLVTEKGISLLLEAFGRKKTKDLSLVFVGRGPLADEIRRARQQPQFGDVHLVDRVPPEELYRYYAMADAVVLPSLTTNTFKEPWGFVVNEAMCQGCAVITSDAVGAGVGGLVEEGVNGFTFPEKDAAALGETIDELFRDGQRLGRMQARSREMIAEWTYPKMAAGFRQALVTASRSGGAPSVRRDSGSPLKIEEAEEMEGDTTSRAIAESFGGPSLS